jgi:hypothetical protein
MAEGICPFQFLHKHRTYVVALNSDAFQVRTTFVA